MPEIITNPEIIALAKKMASDRDRLHKLQNKLNTAVEKKIYPMVDALNAEGKKFFDMMNEEYGWGKWQNFDAKTLTFIPANEFQDSWYVMTNPAVKEKIIPNTPDVVKIQEELDRSVN